MRYILIPALCLSLGVRAEEARKPVPTTVQQVTVFIKGAQVTRNATVALTPGTTTLAFNGLAADIEEKSIQVQGDGAFSILSVSRQKNYLHEQQQADDVSKLKAQLDDLDEKIKHEKNQLHVYQEEATMLGKNQSIAGANTTLTVGALKDAMDFHRARLTEITDKEQAIEKNIRSLTEAQEKIVNQLTSPQKKQDPTSDIIVTVNSKTALTAKFTIRYLVNEAGWYPNYDIRVQDISHPLSLQYKARVFQHCGEEWQRVKLSLSTGNPNDRTDKPTLSPWRLYLYDEPVQARFQDATAPVNQARGRVLDNNGAPVAGASVQIVGRTIGTVTDASGNFSLNLPDGPQRLSIRVVGFEDLEVIANGRDYNNVVLQPSDKKLDEVTVTGYGEANKDTYALERRVTGRVTTSKVRIRGLVSAPTTTPLAITQNFSSTTFTYDIELPYTIASDGKPYTVDIKEVQVPAAYQYFAVPRLDKGAYLTASVVNWEDLNLLEGEVSIYFEGTYLGRSLLDLQHTGDTLQLSLGMDKQVIVNRVLQKDYSKKQLLANASLASRSYELRVKNNKGVPIHITIQDQVPLPASGQVEIMRKEFKGANYNEQTGELDWLYTLAPAEEQKMNLSYTVKYPKNMYLSLD
ncbi:hypothetical protein DCC81_08745 [Chitinophaga parva]|uniref:Mucoidy inhibitor MuiA family protein n=1 Tax=Chitinophaga parva TaxID=2169414 RepID=A0A2T7BPH0_9BACT|nr:DUF4139 domain-containing protein [Chitinophaga parva]PUZ29521.1 hypothetical protein DCC81_08745 [Chitinophaga parva]